MNLGMEEYSNLRNTINSFSVWLEQMGAGPDLVRRVADFLNVRVFQDPPQSDGSPTPAQQALLEEGRAIVVIIRALEDAF